MLGHGCKASMGICVADNRSNESYVVGLRQLPLSLFSTSIQLCSSVQLRVHCRADQAPFIEQDCQKQRTACEQTIAEKYFGRSRTACGGRIKLQKVRADVDVMSTNVVQSASTGLDRASCIYNCRLSKFTNRSLKFVKSFAQMWSPQVRVFCDLLDRLLPDFSSFCALRNYPYARFLMSCCQQMIKSSDNGAGCGRRPSSVCDSHGSNRGTNRMTECKPVRCCQLTSRQHTETESSRVKPIALNNIDGDDSCNFTDPVYVNTAVKNDSDASAVTACCAGLLLDMISYDDVDKDSDERGKEISRIQNTVQQNFDCEISSLTNGLSESRSDSCGTCSFFVRVSDSDSSASSDDDDDDDDDIFDDNSDSDDWDDDEDEVTSPVENEESFLEDLDPLRMTGLYIPHSLTVPVSPPHSPPATSIDSAAETDSRSARWLKRINERWQSWYCSDGVNQSVSRHQCHWKQVKFADDPPMRISFPNEDEWALEYEAARVGPWRSLACDRARFVRRIEETEQLISWVFAPQHRKCVLSKLQPATS